MIGWVDGSVLILDPWLVIKYPSDRNEHTQKCLVRKGVDSGSCSETEVVFSQQRMPFLKFGSPQEEIRGF